MPIFKEFYDRRRVTAIREADAVVAVSNGIASSLAKYRTWKAPVVAMNGVPDDLLHRQHSFSRQETRAIRILYLGEFYLARDPIPLFDALAAIIRHSADVTHMIRLDLIGEVDNTPQGPLAEILRTRGLTDIAVISNRVSYDKAIEALTNADIFMLLAQGQPQQVPNKLYEYLAYRRPIIAIADPDGETASLLKMTGHANTLLSPTSSPDEIQTAMTMALKLAKSGIPVGDEEIIASLTTSRQLTSVVDLVRELSQIRL